MALLLVSLKYFGNSLLCPNNKIEWQTFQLQESVASLIARLSSRVFLGKELCRNEEWLEITSSWTRNAFTASLKMAAIPPFFKPMVSYLLPYCRTIRWQCRRGREIIAPVIEKRRRLKEQARKNGEPIPEFNDALEWAEQEHQGKSYDPAHVQLFLSFAAIHTTTDLVCETLLCLASDPTQIKPLREEIAQELSRGGLKKTSLYSMKLLDSAIKEAQRIKPTGKRKYIYLKVAAAI